MKLYHLFVRRADNSKEYLTSYPMTHEECRIMKSKQSDKTINHVQFEEVQQK